MEFRRGSWKVMEKDVDWTKQIILALFFLQNEQNPMEIKLFI